MTPQSDRYGFRLAGPTLEPIAPMELRSHGIVPGVIQVPHGGQPIVQMCDAQPSGGYPKIGTVIEADLWRLGQAPIGSRVRFVEATGTRPLAARDEAARGSPRCGASSACTGRGARRDDHASRPRRQLAAWLAATGHRRTRAVRARRSPAPAARGEPAGEPDAARRRGDAIDGRTIVRFAGIGVFCTPILCRDALGSPAADVVSAGQLLGLLRVGAAAAAGSGAARGGDPRRAVAARGWRAHRLRRSRSSTSNRT